MADLRARLRRWPDEIVASVIAERVCNGKQAAADLVEEVWAYAADLAGPNPSEIERALTETAALCWLYSRISEWRLESAGSMELHKAHWKLRCIDSAHRRHVEALKALAVVRRLARPAARVVTLGAKGVMA